MKAMARQHGAAIPEMPGIALDMNGAAPTADQLNDESAVFKTAIAISPMQAGYDHNAKVDNIIPVLLQNLSRKPAGN